MDPFPTKKRSGPYLADQLQRPHAEKGELAVYVEDVKELKNKVGLLHEELTKILREMASTQTHGYALVSREQLKCQDKAMVECAHLLNNLLKDRGNPFCPRCTEAISAGAPFRSVVCMPSWNAMREIAASDLRHSASMPNQEAVGYIIQCQVMWSFRGPSPGICWCCSGDAEVRAWGNLKSIMGKDPACCSDELVEAFKKVEQELAGMRALITG